MFQKVSDRFILYVCNYIEVDGYVIVEICKDFMIYKKTKYIKRKNQLIQDFINK